MYKKQTEQAKFLLVGTNIINFCSVCLIWLILKYLCTTYIYLLYIQCYFKPINIFAMFLFLKAKLYLRSSRCLFWKLYFIIDFYLLFVALFLKSQSSLFSACFLDELLYRASSIWSTLLIRKRRTTQVTGTRRYRWQVAVLYNYTWRLVQKVMTNRKMSTPYTGYRNPFLTFSVFI